MQATDLTPRGLELEVDIGNPSPLEERGDHKLGLHSNCWGEVRCIAAHVVALLEITYPCQPIKRGNIVAFNKASFNLTPLRWQQVYICRQYAKVFQRRMI